MTQKERANRTEKILRELNIPINTSLPLIEDESEIHIRKASDIAKRILILTYLNIIADDEVAKQEIIEFLKNESLWDFLSGEEKSLLAKEKLTTKDKINLSWRSEAVWTLFRRCWSYFLTDSLAPDRYSSLKNSNIWFEVLSVRGTKKEKGSRERFLRFFVQFALHTLNYIIHRANAYQSVFI